MVRACQHLLTKHGGRIKKNHRSVSTKQVPCRGILRAISRNHTPKLPRTRNAAESTGQYFTIIKHFLKNFMTHKAYLV